jgi:branched-chain amino acid transport system ATP-binding protein
MSAPILELKDLDVFYGPIQALKKVSLHINEGETVSLIGANGAQVDAADVDFRPATGGVRADLYRGTDITRKSSHYIASNGIAQSPEGRRCSPT